MTVCNTKSSKMLKTRVTGIFFLTLFSGFIAFSEFCMLSIHVMSEEMACLSSVTSDSKRDGFF